MPSFSDFKRTVLKAFAWQGASKLILQGFTWTTTVFVARILSPDDYGTMAIVGVFTGLLFTITNLGLSSGLVQKATTSPTEENAVFWINLLISVVGYAVLYLLAEPVSRFFSQPILSDILPVAATVLFMAGIRVVPMARLLRAMDFKRRSLVDLAAGVIAASTVLAAALLGAGVWSLVYGFLVQNTLMTLGYWFFSRWLPWGGANFREAARTVRYGMKIMGSMVMSFAYRKSDSFIIGKVIGSSALGYYSMAFQFAILPLEKIGSIFNQIAMPAMARITEDPGGSRALFLELHRYLVMLTYPVLVGLALVAEDAITLLLTEKWLPVVPILKALCIVNLLRVSGMIMPPVLNGRGKASWVFGYTTACAVLYPLGFFVGASWGLEGVLMAWFVVTPFTYAFLLFSQLRDLSLGFRDFIESIQKVTIGVALMATAVTAFQSATVDAGSGVRLAGAVVTGAVVYGVAIAIFYRERLLSINRRLRVLRSGKADV